MPKTIIEDHKMQSFASSAGRMLRSVGSRWQTGWRGAFALTRHPLDRSLMIAS